MSRIVHRYNVRGERVHQWAGSQAAAGVGKAFWISPLDTGPCDVCEVASLQGDLIRYVRETQIEPAALGFWLESMRKALEVDKWAEGKVGFGG